MAIAVTQLILFDREGISRCFGEFFFKGTLRVTPNCSIFFTYNCGVLLQKKEYVSREQKAGFPRKDVLYFCVVVLTALQ